ncbi:hypothetical protein M9434_000976 [Picochlorum sp. BPE23]|nr:hypothetical protein M9434_000976 [Picochlorum sp. BPE23]
MGCCVSKPKTQDAHDGAGKARSMLESISMSIRQSHMDSDPAEHLDDLLDADLGLPGEGKTGKGKKDEDISTKGSAKSQKVKQTDFLTVGVLEGTTFLNDYIVVDTLGRGSYGKVKLCLNILDNNLYAIKVVELNVLRQHEKSKGLQRKSMGAGKKTSVDQDEELQREVDVMKALDHPNLVTLYEVIKSTSGKLLMVMEYCEAGPVVDGSSTEAMPEIIAHHIFKQIVLAMEYLHANGIVHGDIKPENMLLSGDGSVKISDFGQSQILSPESSKLTKTLGTPAFLAPEVCAGEEYDGFAADIWSLGVSLYHFIFGELPFKGDSLIDLYDQIADKDITFPENVPLSINLQDLFLRLLNKDPKYRITIEELVSHPWISDCDGTISEEALEVIESAEGEVCCPTTNSDSDKKIDSMTSSKVTASLLNSLSQRSKTMDSRMHTLSSDSFLVGKLDSTASLPRMDVIESKMDEEASMERFESIAEHLVSSQQSILDSRKHDSGDKSAEDALNVLRSHRQSGGETNKGSHHRKKSSLSHDEATAVLAGPLSVISHGMSAGMEDAMAIPYRSPFETTEDSHTVDAIQDASLLQFKAGETIDTIGHGSDYAYFIDEGHVQINYCADLPVSLDEVFQNAVYSVIQSHVSGNLEQADSISYSEHVANLAISQNSKSIWDYIEDRAASIFPGSVGSPGVASKRKLHAQSDPRLQPIAQVLETAEEIVQNSVGGNVGNLLQSTRRKGQFVGAVSMLNPQFYGSKWFANMTAIDDVIVIRMSKSALDRFLVENPMSQIHLRASMATTVSELVKLEALEKIAMARRKMLSQTSDDSITSAIGASLEEVAKHITESAAAGAEILSKLDVFALVGKLRENIDTNSTFKSVFTKKSTKNMKK